MKERKKKTNKAAPDMGRWSAQCPTLYNKLVNRIKIIELKFFNVRLNLAILILDYEMNFK